MHKIIYAADKVMNLPANKIKGFSLLEMLLVLAIASSLVVLMLNYTTQKADEMRRDKTILQMQQILNAGMGFYLNKGYWPLKNATITDTLCGNSWSDLSVMQPNYLPSNLLNNAYGNPYNVGCSTVGGFYAYSEMSTPANAYIIAGKLPLAYVVKTSDLLINLSGGGAGDSIPPSQSSSCVPSGGALDPQCTVVVSNVSIPGQNLNNARSVNFAGLYYSGSCVPAPNCPPGMKADILVSTAAAAGVSDAVTCTSTTAPYSSFTAYARGALTSNDPVAPGSVSGKKGTVGTGPSDCKASSPALIGCVQSYTSGGNAVAFTADGTKYWRVCLSITTEKGAAVYPSTTEGATQYQHGMMMGNIIAITRCVPNSGTENPAGAINVWQPNSTDSP
jgi:prepilin-type N-terminal cleavage/methylation domain-containing protein